MAVFKPLTISQKETDVKKIMQSLYRFSEDLKFTLANLGLDDNFDNSVLKTITERNEKMRTLSFDADGLKLEFSDYTTEAKTRLEENERKISMLVDSGKVVETMLSRMELYGEYITLKTGQIRIDTTNMKLDAAGNVTFSGSITGGSITIADGFRVNPDGSCVISGGLETETLNPTGGIYASELDGFNDDNYINNVEGTITCRELTATSVSCRNLYETSDQRKKKQINSLMPEAAEAMLKEMQPVQYHIGSWESIGFIANNLPTARKRGKYLALSYNNCGAVYAAAIQLNQKRIEKLKERIRRRKNVKL